MPRVRGCVGAIGFRCRARWPQGVTWTNRTTSAPWAAREGHTSVIDAAGAIYVIGGWNGNYIYYSDVWKSTDGGAVVEGTQRVLTGYSRGVPKGYSRMVCKGVLSGTRGVLQGPEC